MCTRDTEKSASIRPIVTLKIPVIENTTLQDFCKITADEEASFTNFKDYIREKLLDLRANETSEVYETGLTRIGLEMAKEVRMLDNEFIALQRKRAFQVTGAALGSCTAMLVAVVGGALAAVPGVVGAGGGLIALLNAIEAAQTKSIQLHGNPCYYLWLLKAGQR
jgi:hypothetical protein